MRRLFSPAGLVGVSLAVAVGGGRLAARPALQDHPGIYSLQSVEAGSRLYTRQCTPCHGPYGDAVAGVDLRRRQFKRAASDEDLARVISSGIPDAGMPGFTFQPAEIEQLIAFIRAGFDAGAAVVKLGDASRGQSLFEGKGGCGTCHRVNGKGPRVAPDLSEIGAVRSPAALLRSLRDPTSAMMPINRPVRAVTKDGRTIRGRRLNEDTFTVQLIDEQEHLVSLVKADLREFEVSLVSPMPAASRLTPDEQTDLVAYLLTLKGQS